MKTTLCSITAGSALLSLSLFLGQINGANAIFPCYYINFIPILGRLCPVSWSKEKIYSGSTSTNGVATMSYNGQVVAFARDDATVRVMKKGILGWDQLGDDIDSSTLNVTYTQLSYNGATLVIGGYDMADSIPKTYIYRFGVTGSLCLLPVVGLLCSWEQDAQFQDTATEDLALSGDFLVYLDDINNATKSFVRKPTGVWEQSSRISDYGIPAADEDGNDLIIWDNSLEGSITHYDGSFGGGCVTGLTPCEYEKGAVLKSAAAGNLFVPVPSKNHKLLAVYDASPLDIFTAVTSIYYLSCLLDCTWELDATVDDSAGFILFPTIDGSVAVGYSFLTSEVQLWFDKPLIGWEYVGDSFDGVSAVFPGSNFFSEWGDQVILMDTAGDIYIAKLA